MQLSAEKRINNLSARVFSYCAYLIAPGSTVTSAAAMVFETSKIVESTTLAEPPDRAVGFISENLKVKG